MMFVPPIMRELAEQIGMPDALILSRMYPGVRMNVPVKACADHPIARAIGIEKMTKLSVMYGDTAISMPNCGPRILKYEIALDTSLSVRQAALETGFTERNIKLLRSKGRQTTPQTDLFNDG